MEQLGLCRLDQRLDHGLPGPDGPGRDVEPGDVRPLRKGRRRRGPLPGKDVLLGPGVNIYRTPLNGRNFEYMGEDPCLAGEMVVPYIRELQKNGVAACVKHYALNNQEQWRGSVDVAVSERALREIYLPAFRKAVVEGGSWTIMGSYNRYLGQHCCHNEVLLNDILRKEWGFDGCVITDWGGAHDTREAALNGLDIEMGTYTNGLTSESVFGYDQYYLATPYLEMLRRGEVPMQTVDDKARNILRLIFRTSMNPGRRGARSAPRSTTLRPRPSATNQSSCSGTTGFSRWRPTAADRFWSSATMPRGA